MEPINNLIEQRFLPKVSVVIPIYNGMRDLPDLLNCLYSQTYPTDKVEYLLIDNASRDDTPNLLQAAIQEAQIRGISFYTLSEIKIQSSYAARNRGIRAGQGEIFAFTDVDCRPQPDWLCNLIAPFIDATVGIVAGAVKALPGNTLLEKYAKKKNILSSEYGMSHHYLPFALGANLAVRRQVLEKVGLFRPYLTTSGDIDLCWRIQLHTTWKLKFAEKAHILHRHRSTWQELFSQWRRYGRGDQYLYELYNLEQEKHKLTSQDYYRLIKNWLTKLPRTSAKLMFRKATLLDLLTTPIFLFTRYAHSVGRQEAQLSEKARLIEWL